ncbi:MAG: hypothetical protein ACJAUZ_003368, partial [Flavobacteriaceae bacterium]
KISRGISAFPTHQTTTETAATKTNPSLDY